MATKRKRASISAAEETSETASTDIDTANGNIPVADRVFEIQVYKDGKSAPKKPRNGDWSDLHEQEGWDHNDKPIYYRISPSRQWESMKKYKNFVVSNKTFGNGDYVYIYHGSEAQGANLDPAKSDCWVAKVLEIRALDTSHVFLRVLWMYWPEELPKGGRQDYHAGSELVASNLMEVMDAMTVTDKADVTHVKERYTEQPAEGLFWRQRFDFLTNKLSNLRKDCHCNGFHNPDKKLIYCANCKTWLHEVCLLNNALTKFSLRKEGKLTAEEDEEAANGQGSDTIEVDKIKKVSADNYNTQVAQAKGRRKSQKFSLSAAKIQEKPSWEGKLEARLEQRTNSAGEETDEATGKVIITDLDGNGDGEPENFKEELKCLSCRAPLADQVLSE